MLRLRHNHMTRHLKPRGVCRACDAYRGRYMTRAYAYDTIVVDDDAFLDTFVEMEIREEIVEAEIVREAREERREEVFGGYEVPAYDPGPSFDFGGDGGSF